MRIYAAIKARMGNQDYFMVSMSAKDLVSEIHLFTPDYFGKSHSDALQREVQDSRIKKGLYDFLGRKERFMSSVVVAALGGNPTFTPVTVTSGGEVVQSMLGITEDVFGLLTFRGGENYYALDGQHRIKAIKEKLALRKPIQQDDPLASDMLSVLMVLGSESESENKIRFRRIFTWMNRYAKPTSKWTNIIMDEDDLYAIVTRWLIENHRLFKSKNGVSDKVNSTSSNVPINSSYFTTIDTLYGMNKAFIKHLECIPSKETSLRPKEEAILECSFFAELVWNALIKAIPELKSKPEEMRTDEVKGTNHMLFRPIGQLAFAEAVRCLIRGKGIKDAKDESVTGKKLNEALKPLSAINYELKEYPWKHLLIFDEIENGKTTFKMRHESRPQAIKLATAILKYMLACPDDSQELKPLIDNWQNITGVREGKVVHEVRKTIEETKGRIAELKTKRRNKPATTGTD